MIVGKDKGREEKIARVYKKQRKILLPGINIYKKHVKKSDQMPQGGVVDVPRPVDVAKVAYICKSCKKQTRIGYIIEGGRKFRICRKCKERID